MARPSRQVDRQLIQAARELLPQTGCSGLNIRLVTERAGANLGMFHYHFKTKSEFLRIVLQEVYEDFFKSLSLDSVKHENELAALRAILMTLGKFVRDNRALIRALFTDVMNGDLLVLQFAQQNFPRHAAIVFGLIDECQKKGYLIKVPYVHVLAFIGPAIALPSIMGAMMERMTVPSTQPLQSDTKTLLPQERGFAGVLDEVLSDEALIQRIDWGLKALAVPKADH